MKSLTKALLLLLTSCGVVCDLTANAAPVKVDHSSKAAVIASFVNAAVLNDLEAGRECLSERTKKEHGNVKKWFSHAMKLELGRLMKEIPCTQENGKWYIGEPYPSVNFSDAVDHSSKKALFTSLVQAAENYEDEAFLECFALDDSRKEEFKARVKKSMKEVRNAVRDNGEEAEKMEEFCMEHSVRIDGKWYVMLE